MHLSGTNMEGSHQLMLQVPSRIRIWFPGSSTCQPQSHTGLQNLYHIPREYRDGVRVGWHRTNWLG